MSVNDHGCPGSHHLEAAQLANRGVFPDGMKVVLFDIDGSLEEFRLIDDCPEWPTHVTARLVPQHTRHTVHG